MSPFPTVAPSDSGSPPTCGTMRTLRRLSSRLGFLRLSLVSRYLAVSLLFCISYGLRKTSPYETGRNECSGSPSLSDRICRRGVDRPPRFLNQPCVRMPRSQTPAGSTIPPSLSTIKYCLPHTCIASASHDCTTFQDSMTQPAYLLLPCFTRHLTVLRAEFATDLLTGFGRVGLAPTG
jgi:hypothetical protein